MIVENKPLKDILDNAGSKSIINNIDWEKTKTTKEHSSKKDEEIQELKNKYLYLQADLENVRRRYNKQIEDIRKYEGEDIFKDFLDIFDNLDFSVNDDIDILNTYNSLLKIFNKYDVRLIYNDEDERPVFFNPEYDEAISSVKTDDPKLDNSINKVYKKGFFFKDKVLRFEKVIVNKYSEI